MDTGAETVDLSYQIPASAPESMTRVGVLLDEIYRNFGDETLLSVQLSPDLLALQRWYLGEFTRQKAGLEPMPWQGPTRLTARQEVS
jgi:hypothetical protein